MSDEIDLAQDLDIDFTRRAIDANRISKNPLKFIGACYNCESELTKGAFCSKDCADEYSWYETRKGGFATFEGAD